LIASLILLLTLLGARDIWTQEHRWADIVNGMFYRHDFLHPYLGQNDYYDKPLLSYWLIALISKLTGGLTTWALRLPSALGGVLAIWSMYRIGTILKNQSLGLLSGWLLLTTFYFVFWARTSSADMLNLAGSLFAVAWYFEKRNRPGFFDHMIFFLILVLTSLCKGLVGAIIPCIAVSIDIFLQRSWKKQFTWSVFLAMIPALVVYMLPFWASSYFGGESYHENGLYLVYRENILRYFQPFDHQGSLYTYFLYLPIYLLPWSIFFILALWSIKKHWQSLTMDTRWLVWTVLALFVFFTLSGSRRSYYVLPIIPFAILLTADWILRMRITLEKKPAIIAALIVFSYGLFFCSIDLLPAWYYSKVGTKRFAEILKQEAIKQKPWEAWHVILLDAESKLNFYLQLPPTTPNFQIKGSSRNEQTTSSLAQSWPILASIPPNTIVITRKLYEPLLRSYLPDYRIVEIPMRFYLPLIKKHDTNVSIAFIPPI
jgi:4-amino-4-deoxy-L-arabinose transferase-like glycosyltransferase